MKAIVVTFALAASPSAAVSHHGLSEPILMVLSGALLLTVAALLKRASVRS